MNILDKIIVDKKREVILKKSIIPVSQLEASVFFEKKTLSLSNNLRNSTSGIIAEHKRRSPSKAEINYGFVDLNKDSNDDCIIYKNNEFLSKKNGMPIENFSTTTNNYGATYGMSLFSKLYNSFINIIIPF